MKSEKRFVRWIVIISLVAVGLTTYQATRKAARGGGAIIRWTPLIEKAVIGYDVYIDGTYPNPPLLAFLLFPLTRLDAIACAWCWIMIKLLFFVLSIYLALSLVAAEGGLRRSRAALSTSAICLILIGRPVLGDLQHGNVNLVIVFLCLVSLWAFQKRWTVLSGLTIALATAFKLTPALFIAYYAWKRQWSVVASSAVGLVLFLILMPSLVLGLGRNTELLDSWRRVMIWPYLVGGQVDVTQTNQSLPGLIHRLTTDRPGLVGARSQIAVNLIRLDPAQVRWLLRVLTLLLLATLASFCRTTQTDRTTGGRSWDSPNRSGAELAALINPFVLEFSLVFVSMLLLSERSWKHHYVMMLLPYACVAASVVLRSRRGLGSRTLQGVLVICFCLMLCTSSAVGGHFFAGLGHKYAQAYGFFTLSAILMFATLLRLLIWSRAQPAASATTLSSDAAQVFRTARASASA